VHGAAMRRLGFAVRAFLLLRIEHQRWRSRARTGFSHRLVHGAMHPCDVGLEPKQIGLD
jgi:hypothetical protein